MSGNTKIEWCDATVNHWTGCTAVSPACDNCYAKRMAGRLWGAEWGSGKPRHQFAGASDALRALDRKAQRLGLLLGVFHNSLSDFFDNETPVQWRIEAMRAIVDTPNLIHLLLTKRIGNAAEMLEQAFRAVHGQRQGWADNVLPNVRIGATICNQFEADRDLPKLERVPAAGHFVSIEPMIGEIDLKLMQYHDTDDHDEQGRIIANTRRRWLRWVICGGESGPNARPMHPDWARSLRDQCQAAGLPFFFKQWGEWIPYEDSAHPPFKWSQHGNEIDGHVLPDFDSEDGQRQREWHCDWSNMLLARRVGKKAAGRLLDGREWREVPR